MKKYKKPLITKANLATKQETLKYAIQKFIEDNFNNIYIQL